MSTLTEIRTAAGQLTPRQQKALMNFLSRQQPVRRPAAKARARGLVAASRPPLEGLPADLSVNTRQKVKSLIAKRHAANR